MESIDSKEDIRRAALAGGFDSVGFARAGPAPGGERFFEWLERGHAGSMDWLRRTAGRRADPRAVLPGARTVISLALFYGGGAEDRSCRSGDEAARLAASGQGEIARYARGTDYHRVMERRLVGLCRTLRERHPAEGFRWYVDTGPVLERAWAQAGGLGWIGKNTCAIDPRRGSYFFIGV